MSLSPLLTVSSSFTSSVGSSLEIPEEDEPPVITEVKGSLPHLSIRKIDTERSAIIIRRKMKINIQDQYHRLVTLIVELYNKKILSNQEEAQTGIYEQRGSCSLGDYDMTLFTASQIKIHGHIEELREYGINGCIGSQSEHYLYFFLRVATHTHRLALFALTSNRAWQVVDQFSDYTLPNCLAKRLLNPSTLSIIKEKELVGSVWAATKWLKEGYDPDDPDHIERVFIGFTASLKVSASVYRVPCFLVGKEPKTLMKNRKVRLEIQRGAVRFCKGIRLGEYPDLFNHIVSVCEGSTRRIDDEMDWQSLGRKEIDDPRFGFLDYLVPVEQGICHTLDLCGVAVEKIIEALERADEPVTFMLCHKYGFDYYLAPQYRLEYKKATIWEGEDRLSEAELFQYVRNSVPSLCDPKRSKKVRAHELKKLTLGFVREGKWIYAPLQDYFEGEVYKNSQTFFKVYGLWHQANYHYLAIVNRKVQDLLNSHLMRENHPGSLTLGWDRNRWQESDYNCAYHDENEFLVGDKIIPHGIELFDLLRDNGKELFLYQVKEGFGQHTRDACSQILNAAKCLSAALSQEQGDNILDAFWNYIFEKNQNECQMAQVKLENRTKSEWLELFLKKERPKIHFVYAVLDQHQPERLLQDAIHNKEAFTEQDFVIVSYVPSIRKKLIQKLEGFRVLRTGGIVAKGFEKQPFDSFNGLDFEDPTLNAQKPMIYRILRCGVPVLNSTIASLELLHVSKMVKSLGFSFDICQIRREGRGALPLSDFSPMDYGSDDQGVEYQNSLVFEIANSLQLGLEKTWIGVYTEPDNASALHALLGEKNDDDRYMAVPSGLRARRGLYGYLSDPKKQQLWNSDFELEMKALVIKLFRNQPNGVLFFGDELDDEVDELWSLGKKLLMLDRSKKPQKLLSYLGSILPFKGTQEELLAHLLLDAGKRDLLYLIGSINFTEMKGIFKGSSDIRYYTHINKMHTKMSGIFRKVKQSKSFKKRFLELVLNEEYHISDNALSMAAKLMARMPVILVKYQDGKYSGQHLNDKREADPIVIYTNGAHYERCEAID